MVEKILRVFGASKLIERENWRYFVLAARDGFMCRAGYGRGVSVKANDSVVVVRMTDFWV